MNFDEVEKIIEEGGNFKKAIAGILLGTTLAGGTMAQDAKVRTRGPSNINVNHSSYKVDDARPLELKDTILQMPEIDKSEIYSLYQMTLSFLGNKKNDYLKIQNQYLNKKITKEEAIKKLVDDGILNASRAKGQPYFWDNLKS